MSALNVLGGIATGYNQSVDDEYRRKEQKFIEAQRQRMLKEQADEDVTGEKLRGLSRTKKVEAEGPPDPAGVWPQREVPKSDSEYTREVAGVLEGSGSLKNVERGLTMRQGATQMAEVERQQANRAKKEAILARWEPARKLLDTPDGVVRAAMEYGMPYYNQQVKDGHTVAVAPDGAGGMMMVTYGPDKKVVDSQAIDQADLKNMTSRAIIQSINHEMGLVDDEGFRRWEASADKDVQLGLEQKKVGIMGRQADTAAAAQKATEEHYKAEDKRWEKGGVNWELKQMELASHERVARIHASAAKGLNPQQELERRIAQEHYDDMRKYAELAKNPEANFDALQQLALDISVKYPQDKITLRSTDPETGLPVQYSESHIGLVTKKLARQSGLAALPRFMQPQLEEAATRSRGNKDRFLSSPEAAKAIKDYGANPDELAAKFLGAATPAKPAAKPSTAPQSTAPAVPYGTKNSRLSAKNVSAAAAANAEEAPLGVSIRED